MQVELEGISDSLRIPGSKSLGPIAKAVRKAENVLGKEKQGLIRDFAPDKKAEGEQAIADLERAFAEFDKVIDTGDKQEVPIKQQECLTFVGQIEEAMVKGFPFQVPSKYDNLPQLKGRALLEMKVNLANPRESGTTSGIMKLVVDGYNAPVTAGNFVDLVQKKFYDGMEIQRADGFVVQTGKPDNADGYVDPKTGQVRKMPFEIKVAKDKAPIYEDTLEDIGRFNDDPALPFNAFGTMALARQEFDANSGSSQVFWLLKESELTPTGANLLDGRYAVFGYTVEGSELLQELSTGDKIEYVKVLAGSQYLQQPKDAAAPSDFATSDI
jgi:cyclophilin family peptidyl-prolyl cis-trans isomerase